MSYSVDVNVLVYASDRSSSQHAAALHFLASRRSDPDILCLAWPTLMAYLRIATHPRIFAQPLSPAEALENVEALLALPRVHVLSEAEGFLTTYRSITDGQVIRGNLVPDAHVAALLLQHGVRTFYTGDADFRRFDFLDVRNPFS